jgi:hypothetical protein
VQREINKCGVPSCLGKWHCELPLRETRHPFSAMLFKA